MDAWELPQVDETKAQVEFAVWAGWALPELLLSMPPIMWLAPLACAPNRFAVHNQISLSGFSLP